MYVAFWHAEKKKKNFIRQVARNRAKGYRQRSFLPVPRNSVPVGRKAARERGKSGQHFEVPGS